MYCVETIKDNIIAIQSESVNNKRVIDKAIDTYLDIVLEFQKDIRSMNNSMDKLYELLYSSLSTLTKSDYLEIISLHKKLIRNLVALYKTYMESNFYAGIKTDLKRFKSGIDDLQEISNDMKTFIIDLPQNKKYKSLANIINTL